LSQTSLKERQSLDYGGVILGSLEKLLPTKLAVSILHVQKERQKWRDRELV